MKGLIIRILLTIALLIGGAFVYMFVWRDLTIGGPVDFGTGMAITMSICMGVMVADMFRTIYKSEDK